MYIGLNAGSHFAEESLKPLLGNNSLLLYNNIVSGLGFTNLMYLTLSSLPFRAKQVKQEESDPCNYEKCSSNNVSDTKKEVTTT